MQSIVETILPRYCYGCGNLLIRGEKILCLGCSMELDSLASSFYLRDYTQIKYSNRSTANEIAFFRYSHNGCISSLVRKLKYNEDIILGNYIVDSFISSLHHHNWIKDIDYIIPLPLHLLRRSSRGYNQSEIIAKRIGKEFGIKVASRLIIRKKYTRSQASISYKKKHRLERLIKSNRGIFYATRPSKLKNKHILIIDDVITTGYTINNCIDSVRNIPGIKISLLFLTNSKDV